MKYKYSGSQALINAYIMYNIMLCNEETSIIRNMISLENLQT